MNDAETENDINAVIEAHTRAMAARLRGAEAMKSIANGVFDDATPTKLAWRGVWGPRELGSNRNPTMSTTVAFYAPLAHVLALAPKGTTPHLWTSFKSMSAGETRDGDVHAAVAEGYNAWSNVLGYQHPKDVEGDEYSMCAILGGGELSYLDGGLRNDGLEHLMWSRIARLVHASNGRFVFPGGDKYISGCRAPGEHTEAYKDARQNVTEEFPGASREEIDNLVRLMYWRDRRSYVVLCVAFLTREQMAAARTEHEAIKAKAAEPDKRAAQMERRAKREAKRAPDDTAATRAGAKQRRRESLVDVTNTPAAATARTRRRRRAGE